MIKLSATVARYGIYYPSALLGGKNVAWYLRQLKHSQHWPLSQLETFRSQRLAQILTYARENVPFYSDRIPSTDLRLSEVPPTTKADLRERAKEMRSRTYRGFVATKTTGGSTGEPTTVLKNPRALARELAATWRGYSWAGVHVGDRQARFWSVPVAEDARRKARLTDIVCNRVRLSAFDFNAGSFERYLKNLQAFEPAYAYGYVSMLRQYADFLRNSSRQIPSLRAVVTTAEALEQEDRTAIEAGFGVRVYNEYGSAELGTIAHECEKGSLHISAENLVVEVLNESGIPVIDEDGEIVATDLDNTVMPLIRYRTGDIGRITSRSCDCGRPLPLLSAIRGRAYDIIVNSIGRSFHGSFFTGLFADLKRAGLGVSAFQVIQRSSQELLIRYIPGSCTCEQSLGFVQQRIHSEFDPHVKLVFEQVQQIERERSGKIRVVKRA